MARPLRELVEAPFAYRKAPTILVAASFLIMLALWVGVSWRLSNAREADVRKGFLTAHQIAATVSAQASTRIQSVLQAKRTLEEANGLAAGNLGKQLGLGEGRAFLLDAQGRARPGDAGVHIEVDTSGISEGTVSVTPSPASLGSGLLLVTAVTRGHTPGTLAVHVPLEAVLDAGVAATGIKHAALELALDHKTVFTAPTANRADVETVRTKLFDIDEGVRAPDWPGTYFFAEVPVPNTRMTARAAISQTDALEYHNDSARPGTIAVGAILGGIGWFVFIAAAIAFKRALLTQLKLNELVALDPLTQLPNRRTFTALLQQGLAHSQRTGIPYGLLFIDLDNFKYVNDSLGHDAGDLLLQAVAARLSEAVRASDYVCRLGGDEFTVLLTQLERPEDAEDVAQRILAALAKPIHVADTDLRVSASVGIALAPKDAASTAQLLCCADLAVYRAKDSGKAGYAFFDVSLKEKAENRSRVSQDIRVGLDEHQFHLVYQPKVELSSGSVIGHEALLRWQHPQRGAVSPAEFIPIAEETRLIEELGDFVLQSVIVQLYEWHRQGKGWQCVAVNVSAGQLKSRALVERLRALLAQYQVPAHCLQVELTESMLAIDDELATELIAEFKSLGLQVAVDDFGTGYSSLSALKRYDVDYLKVDRSFVRDADTNPNSYEICRAVVQLAHGLGVRAIAEGIETAGQLEAMVRLGCDEGQGFLMSKPLGADKAPGWRWLQSHQ